MGGIEFLINNALHEKGSQGGYGWDKLKDKLKTVGTKHKGSQLLGASAGCGDLRGRERRTRMRAP